MTAEREASRPQVRPPSASPTTAAGGRPVPSDRIEHIVGRAAELQRQQGLGNSSALSEEDIVRIGAEVGLDPAFVRRALAEERAETLTPPAPGGSGLLDLLCGPGWVRVQRVVPGDSDSVQRRIETHLSTHESLKAIRRRPGASTWEPATGWMDHLQRSLDVRGHGYDLAATRGIELNQLPVESGHTQVSLTADLGNQRNHHVVGWLGGLGALVLAGTFIAIGEFGLDTAGALVATAGLGVAALFGVALGTRATLSGLRRRLIHRLEGVLDRVEAAGG